MERREDGLLVGPLAALPGRSARVVRALADRVGTLPFKLSRNGPMVCGGAVLRALIGDESRSDLDVFCPDVSDMKAIASILSQLRWQRVQQDRDPYGGNDLWPTARGRWRSPHAEGSAFEEVDVVTSMAVPLICALASFDIVACSVATDGERLFATPAAWEDIERRRLRVRYPTRKDRLLKWVRMGLFPDEIDPDRFRDEPAIQGWLDPNASLDTGTKIALARARANPASASVRDETRPPRTHTDPVTS